MCMWLLWGSGRDATGCAVLTLRVETGAADSEERCAGQVFLGPLLALMAAAAVALVASSVFDKEPMNGDGWGTPGYCPMAACGESSGLYLIDLPFLRCLINQLLIQSGVLKGDAGAEINEVLPPMTRTTRREGKRE
jgi:hypothetical protein